MTCSPNMRWCRCGCAQMEMGQLVQEVVRRQDAQAAEIRELRRALDLLTHKESLGAWL